MTEQRVQRRLAAILAADVVGYSALMQRAEEATYGEFERLKGEVIEPGLFRHDGRLVKTTGDGALAEFASPSAAVRCAVEIQESIASGRSSLRLRIGVNLGEVIVAADGDLFGDGINIAVRLEGIANPGGILISEKVYSEVESKLDVRFEDRGVQQLKNISKRVRAYAVRAGAHSPLIDRLSAAPALPDKPSIAVLPFENLSGDPEQEYFADGMVEDIIAGLSRNRLLFVIARNSSFAYKGKSPDIRQVGRDLGVRYVLEGSVRKAGNRVRITGQLIDAATGGHIWADRFDGNLEDIFELQDQMTSSVIGGILPSLDMAEMERAKRKTENLQAYDYYLRSLASLSRFTPEASPDALANARKSVELDPEFALGHTMIAWSINVRWAFRWTVDHAAEAAEAEQAIRRALALGSHDARVLAICGQALFVVLRRPEEAALHLAQAIKFNPNLADAWTTQAAVRIARDEPQAAIGDLERAMRLSPVDIRNWYKLTLMARAHNLCGKHEEALACAAEAPHLRPNFPHAATEQIVANTLAGHIDVARELMTRYRALQPNDRVSSYRPPHLSASSTLKYREALRVAGLPE